jgi:sec-independent protein translocase protein TatC
MSVLERHLAFFRPHHQELRDRLIRCFAAIALCSVGVYFFAEQIAYLFIEPLYRASPLVYRLVYTNLPEAFLAYIKLSLLLGLILSTPYLIYQGWRFVSPGLHANEKKIAVIVVFWAGLLFSTGAAFALFIVLPKLLAYFLSYANESLEPLPKFGKYLSFVARLMLTLGMAFQIPFLMVMAVKANLVETGYYRTKRYYFYAAIVILAFLLSAGDFMATGLLSLPLFLLYESGALLSRVFRKSGQPAA